MIFLGPPGAGKSTIAQLMGRNHGYVYYEADCFFKFANPFIDPNSENLSLAAGMQTPLKGLSEESIKAISACTEAFQEVQKGIFDNFEENMNPVYDAMGADVVSQRKRLGGNWAIAQAVISKNQRKFKTPR